MVCTVVVKEETVRDNQACSGEKVGQTEIDGEDSDLETQAGTSVKGHKAE